MEVCLRSAARSILLAVAAVAAVGCSDSVPVESVPDPMARLSDGASTDTATTADTTAGNASHDAASHGVSERAASPVCDGWKSPAVAFAISGEMHGYLEPCGCSEPQYGGIARRASLLTQLEERGWNLVPLELGGTLKRTRQQSQFKFQTLLSALQDMKYKALALGLEELQLGPEFLSSQHVVDPDKPDASVSFLCCNVVLFQFPDLGTPVPWKIVTVGDRKIGVTAVFGSSLKSRLSNNDPATLEVLDPEESLRKAVTALRENGAELLVLLSHADLRETRSFAERFPEFQLICSTGPVEEPLADNPTRIGGTMLVTVGHKGKYTGIVGWYPDQAERPFRFELVKLDGDRFQDDPRMLNHMRYYQDMLKDSLLAETEPALTHPAGAEFVGADKCAGCHTKAFEKWSSTGHATAFDSLRSGRRNISRIYDPECLACHVTGWNPSNVLRYESGYLNEQKTPHLMGNQCENCHGPGSRHIELVEADQITDARKLMKVTLEQAKNNVCYSCHDLDNSPHFDFDSYWKDIAHPGLD